MFGLRAARWEAKLGFEGSGRARIDVLLWIDEYLKVASWLN